MRTSLVVVMAGVVLVAAAALILRAPVGADLGMGLQIIGRSYRTDETPIRLMIGRATLAIPAKWFDGLVQVERRMDGVIVTPGALLTGLFPSFAARTKWNMPAFDKAGCCVSFLLNRITFDDAVVDRRNRETIMARVRIVSSSREGGETHLIVNRLRLGVYDSTVSDLYLSDTDGSFTICGNKDAALHVINPDCMERGTRHHLSYQLRMPRTDSQTRRRIRALALASLDRWVSH